MKNLIHGIIAIALFGFVGNAQNAALVGVDVVNKTDVTPTINHFSPTVLYCFNVGGPGIKIKTSFLEINIVSISAEVCCWPRSAHSPGYKCALGSTIGRREAFINVKSLGTKVVDLINENNSKSVGLSKFPIYSDGVNNYSVPDGEYEIQNIDDENFIKIDLDVSKK